MWGLIAVPTECIQEEDESSNQLETVDEASLIVKMKWLCIEEASITEVDYAWKFKW